MPADQSARFTPRQMNEQMVERLLAGQPDPIAEGGYGLRVLEHTGRGSARVHRTPIGVLQHGGASHLVCPDRTRDWPRNLLASPACVLRGGTQHDQRTARPVDGNDGIEVVAAYLSVVQAPWALRAFGFSDHPTHEEIELAMPRMIVFRLDDPHSQVHQFEQER